MLGREKGLSSQDGGEGRVAPLLPAIASLRRSSGRGQEGSQGMHCPRPGGPPPRLGLKPWGRLRKVGLIPPGKSLEEPGPGWDAGAQGGRPARGPFNVSFGKGHGVGVISGVVAARAKAIRSCP